MRLSSLLPLFFFVFAAPSAKSLGLKTTDDPVLQSKMTTNQNKLNQLEQREKKLQTKLQDSLKKERATRREIGSLTKQLGATEPSEAKTMLNQLKAANKKMKHAKEATKHLENQNLKVAILKHKAATKQYHFELEAQIKQLEKIQRKPHPEAIHKLQQLAAQQKQLGIMYLSALADRKTLSVERTRVSDQIHQLNTEIPKIENIKLQGRLLSRQKANLARLEKESKFLSTEFEQLTKAIKKLPQQLASVKKTMEATVTQLGPMPQTASRARIPTSSRGRSAQIPRTTTNIPRPDSLLDGALKTDRGSVNEKLAAITQNFPTSTKEAKPFANKLYNLAGEAKPFLQMAK